MDIWGGSSPLTRGKPISPSWNRVNRGLIPAHAGKTGRGHRRGARPGAHPRSRGENFRLRRGQVGARGSSPLTRGKPRRRTCTCMSGRLIPAHAGKTRASTRRTARSAAHPRSRGENMGADMSALSVWGSSPLTRGKLDHEVGERPRERLIPAHAGKTTPSPSQPPPVRAHPRSRGENASHRSCRLSAFGSSPLTRGKPQRWNGPRAGIGLIPAHAGKTRRQAAHQRHEPAHPRSRGENIISDKVRQLMNGSSPLTRGKHYPRRA